MRLKFQTLYRASLLLLALTLCCSLWAAAQDQPAPPTVVTNTVTNIVTTITTNSAAATNPAASSTNLLSRPFPGISETQLTFGLNQVSHLQTKVFGQPLWKYLASLIYIFLAFYVSKFLDHLTRIWLKRWAERTATRFDDLVIGLLNGPVKIVSFIILLNIGLSVFNWPDTINRILSKGLVIIIAATLTYLALKLVDLLLGWWRLRVAAEDPGFNQQLFPIVNKSLKLFVIVVAVLVTSDNMGINITAAIASLSIGGLALGLAAQDTLSNMFGAIAVFVDKPFLVGDRIQLDGVDGTVESIGLRSTRVRNLDGHLITVPNRTMGNASITNITRRPNIKTLMNIGITYDTPVAKVKQALAILAEIYKQNPKTFDVIISFNKFENSSLNILVVHWWNSTDYKEYLAGLQAMNLQVKERFDAENIEFAFPTQTLHVKQDSPPPPAPEKTPDKKA